ncbi:MAG: SDR family oxidoreductase [Verrucomicrobia bacterium]|nr:SDR family oxidoreductase [Verrucomicrobiota bacterium]
MSKRVLISGGTGFLGSYLLLYLLKCTDSTVYCLCRKKGNVAGQDRVRKKIRKMVEGPLARDARFAVDLIRERKRIVFIEGDIRSQNLGLSDQDYASLKLDEIWHVAAAIDFSAHRRKQIVETNVQGTRNILALVRDTGYPVLNYVSTAYVCGQRAGNIPEEVADENYAFNNSYEESKRIAEREILHAGRGLRFRIFRPSVIVGHSHTLEFDSSSGLYSYLSVLLRLKNSIQRRMPEYFRYNTLKLLFDDEATLNMICVDHVVETMCQIAAGKMSENEIIHIVNPYPITLSHYMRRHCPIVGIEIENVTNAQNLSPVDTLMNAQSNIFAAYRQNNKQFEFAKMIRFSNLAPESFRIDDAMLEALTRRVYEHFQKVQERRNGVLR